MFGECALFVDPHNPRDIADKILYLLDNKDKAKELGESGRKLVEKKYNWKKMTEIEKKRKKKEYMREYYQNKRRGDKRTDKIIKEKKPGFTKEYGTFIVKFQ